MAPYAVYPALLYLYEKLRQFKCSSSVTSFEQRENVFAACMVVYGHFQRRARSKSERKPERAKVIVTEIESEKARASRSEGDRKRERANVRERECESESKCECESESEYVNQCGRRAEFLAASERSKKMTNLNVQPVWVKGGRQTNKRGAQ